MLNLHTTYYEWDYYYDCENTSVTYHELGIRFRGIFFGFTWRNYRKDK